MSARKKVTLTAWIREAMAEEVDGSKVTVISLCHMVAQQSKEIYSVKFGSKVVTAEDLGAVFQSKAETYAQDLSGAQTFQLIAFYGTKDPSAFHPFVIQPALNPDALLPSEPATESGRTQQGMRHAEMVFQSAMRKQEHLDRMTLEYAQLQHNNARDLMATNMATFNMLKELLMAQALNTHELRMKELNHERETDERKKWLSYIPLLANTLLGRELFPQSTADTVLMEQIVENIDPDTIGILGQFVKPELMGPLMARFEEIHKKKRIAAENRKAALTAPMSMNPLLDASGDTVNGGKADE